MIENDPVARFVKATVAKSDPCDRNEDARLYEAMKEAFHELNATASGRLAFRHLLQHESDQVRLWVAAQLLSEGDQLALATLEALATQHGLISFNAQVTLAEYEQGSLCSPFGSPIAEMEHGSAHGAGALWQSPAAEDSIQSLVDGVGFVLPESYIEFLGTHNGGEGDVATQAGWVSLWPAEEVVGLNEEYNVAEYFPGYFAFGSDGGGEMLAFEVINGRGSRVVMLPFVGDVADAKVVAESFNVFLDSISGKPRKQ